MAEHPPPPCILCADRHARHFAIWAPFTRQEVALLALSMFLGGLLLGWFLGFELQDYYARTGRYCP